MAKKGTTSKDVLGDPVRVKVEVKHQFTVEEYRERTDKLTRMMHDVEIKEEQIKAAAATAKAEVKALKAEVNDLANQLRNGTETQTVEAFVEYRRKQGKKRLLWNCPGKPDHRKLIREEPMTEEDYASLEPELPVQEQSKPAVPTAETPPEPAVPAPPEPA